MGVQRRQKSAKATRKSIAQGFVACEGDLWDGQKASTLQTCPHGTEMLELSMCSRPPEDGMRRPIAEEPQLAFVAISLGPLAVLCDTYRRTRSIQQAA